MKRLIVILGLLSNLISSGQEVNITPKPVSLTIREGSFAITAKTKIYLSNRELTNSALFLKKYLQEFYGMTLESSSKESPGDIELILTSGQKMADNEDAYSLQAKTQHVRIYGKTPRSVFYGIQTLIQLLPTEHTNTIQIPAVDVSDYPRFSYRGLMLDCGRHFFSVDFIKKYIDFIALHKMNTFHWHLTEDQGWRIEIRKYPRLTATGSCRNGTIIGHHPGIGNDSIRNCGFYSQQQIRDVVKYAADRYINIIPEIEMPGHSSAAIAAYPQLSCFPDENTQISKNVAWEGSDSGKQVQQSWGVYKDVYCPSDFTFTFLENVLDEVMELFPSKYIHIGGDECPKDFWKRSSFCQDLIKQKGLKNEEALQSYFIQRIEKYINSRGRELIGWDEILEGGLAPNATVMSWRGEQGGIDAAKQQHHVIMTPGAYVYLDHSQSKHDDSLTIGGFLPLDKVYSYEPVPKELNSEEAKYILGAQANIWTEYMAYPSKVEYMIFPRLTALSEVLWSPKGAKSWENFQKRLPAIEKRYDLWQVSYFRGQSN
ncbi:MAG TPA: beta-N-acetylhexosaminidase [Puia sp.]|nr:beta-N-acetylhexosaminidase [Puia sp.]